MIKIDSAKNPTFKRFLSLTNAKGLKKEGLFLLSGEKLIREYLKSPHLKLAGEIVSSKLQPLFSKDKATQLPLTLFDQVDVLGTHFNILVLEQPEIKNISDISHHKPRGLEVVIPIGDPGNLGALIRSCEAFAVPRVILTEEAAHPFLPKAVKASAGSLLRLPLLRGPKLRTFPDTCIALDAKGTPIADFSWPRDGFLVVGEEGPGLGKKTFKHRLRIPTQKVESLNAVVAASIALAYKFQ